MDTLLSGHCHYLPQGEVVTLLKSDVAHGLDMFEVVHCQMYFGPNRLTLKKGAPPLVLFLLQLHQSFIYFSNRWLVLSMVAMALLQVLFVYSPAMNYLFGSAPLGVVEWVWVLTGNMMIYTVVNTEKWRRCRAKSE